MSLRVIGTLFTITLPSLISCVPTEGGGSPGSGFAAAVPFALIFVLFYFLILRPQQKQSREKEAMLKDLKRGDKIVTSGGIVGRIISTTEDMITLEIAKGVNVQITRSSVTAKLESDKDEQKSKGG